MAIHKGLGGWSYSDDLYYELWRLSDAELSHENLEAATTLLTGTPGFNEEYDAKAKSAAIDAIMREKKRRPGIKKSADEERNKTKEKLLVKLKAAHTPNGQLIASVLEEENGKTKEEIMAWCDELGALSAEEMDALLQGLIEDDVVYCADEKYYLNHICTGGLCFNYSEEAFKDWAYRLIISRFYEDKGNQYLEKVTKMYEPALEAVYYVGSTGYPFYFEDMLDYIDIRKQRSQFKQKWSDDTVKRRLESFVECGVLLRIEDMYCVPFLGEKAITSQPSKIKSIAFASVPEKKEEEEL